MVEFITITMIANDGGEVHPPRGSSSYTIGTRDECLIYPDSNHLIDYWYVKIGSDERTGTSWTFPFTATENGTIWVYFKPKVAPPPPDTTPPTISQTFPEPGGNYQTVDKLSVNCEDPSGINHVDFWMDSTKYFPQNASGDLWEHSLPQAASDGSHSFDCWVFDKAGNSSHVAGSFQVTPPGPADSTVDLTVTGQGTTTPSVGSHVYPLGSDLYVYADPVVGWHLAVMKRGGQNWTSSSPGEFLNLGLFETIEVVFEQDAETPPAPPTQEDITGTVAGASLVIADVTLVGLALAKIAGLL